MVLMTTTLLLGHIHVCFNIENRILKKIAVINCEINYFNLDIKNEILNIQETACVPTEQI